MDVVGVEDTMLDDLDTRESHIRVRQLVDECMGRPPQSFLKIIPQL